MKNSFIKLLSVAAAALALSGTAQAALITGTVDFSGGVTLNNANLHSSTGTVANGFLSVVVNNPIPSPTNLGSIANGTPVTMTSSVWLYNSGAIANFWSTAGYTFGLVSSGPAVLGFTPQGVPTLSVSGIGIIRASGFDDTTGTWTFSTNGGGNGQAGFSFSSSQTTNAPDGGSTAVMAGLALVGLALAGRRFGAVKL